MKKIRQQSRGGGRSGVSVETLQKIKCAEKGEGGTRSAESTENEFSANGMPATYVRISYLLGSVE